MDLQVKDGGRSECLLVMRRIEVELVECAVRALHRIHHLTRKRADFQTRSLVTREFVRTFGGGKANDGGGNTGWCAPLPSD
jgi:hypothetical protein